MNIQMTAMPRVDTKFGKFELGFPQLPPGAASTVISRYAQSPIQQLNPNILPAAAPALAPSAPGAILPTQSPAYLFPVNPAPAAAAEAEKGPESQGLVLGILGGLVVLGALVLILTD